MSADRSPMPALFEIVVTDGREIRTLPVTAAFPTSRDIQIDVWWGGANGVVPLSLASGKIADKHGSFTRRPWRIDVPSARAARQWLKANGYTLPRTVTGPSWYASEPPART